MNTTADRISKSKILWFICCQALKEKSLYQRYEGENNCEISNKKGKEDTGDFTNVFAEEQRLF